MDSSGKDLMGARKRNQVLWQWCIVPSTPILNREWKDSRLCLTAATSFVGMDGWITAMNSSGSYRMTCATIAPTSQLSWLLTQSGAASFCRRSLETSHLRCGIRMLGLSYLLATRLDHALSTIIKTTTASSGRATLLH